MHDVHPNYEQAEQLLMEEEEEHGWHVLEEL
jgi:hypothetical protein